MEHTKGKRYLDLYMVRSSTKIDDNGGKLYKLSNSNYYTNL